MSKVKKNFKPDFFKGLAKKYDPAIIEFVKKELSSYLTFNQYSDLIRSKADKIVTLEEVKGNIALEISMKEVDLEGFNKYVDSMQSYFKKGYEIVFKNFIISWKSSNKFSVPILTNSENSNILNVNFAKDPDTKNRIFQAKVEEYMDLLFDKGFILQIVPGALLTKSENETYKLLFNEEVVIIQK